MPSKHTANFYPVTGWPVSRQREIPWHSHDGLQHSCPC